LGSFAPVLTATDNDAGTASKELTPVTVVNLPPTAAGSCAPTETDRLTPVQCADTSTDRDGTIQGWLWDFGDGTSSRDAKPSHVFLQGGFFDVTLEVTDNDGSVARATQRVWVCAPGVSPSALLEPGHQHLEVEGCVVLHGGQLLP
jgi:PKD repeat protein